MISVDARYYEDDLFLHNGAEATTTNKLGTFKGSKKPAPIIALQGNLSMLHATNATASTLDALVPLQLLISVGICPDKKKTLG